MIINVINNTDSLVSINDLGLTITASGTMDLAQHKSMVDIAESNDLVYKIALGTVTINDGEDNLETSQAIRYVSQHNIILGPKSSWDSRPIVRADSRPVGYVTMFTMAGDTASGIGDGKAIWWDFSTDDDIVTASGVVPDGYKLKRIRVSFNEDLFIKEGCLYFHNAKKGSYLHFSVVCPAGQYYLDSNSNPVLAQEDTIVFRYVNHHFFAGTCAMGDELNTESASDNKLLSNYEFWIEVFAPESDTDSYGYGEVEVYRQRTYFLPS